MEDDVFEETTLTAAVNQARRYYQHMAERATIRQQDVLLLLQVANGELNRETASEEQYFDVKESFRELCEFLFSIPRGYDYSIPLRFWSEPGLGQLLARVRAWLEGDDWVTYTQAAALLFPGENLSQDVAVARIRRLTERGKLTRYIDPYVPNPQHANRVSRTELEELLP